MATTSGVPAARQATIRRAIALIDTADPADLAGYLAAARIHQRWRDDPTALRDNLAAADPSDWAAHVGAWKGAQRILQAAGLPT